MKLILSILTLLTSTLTAATIFEALEARDMEAVQSILGSGAQALNTPGQFGLTPVNYTAYHGDLHLFKLLVDAGADLNIGDNEGSLPLHNAAAGGQQDIIVYLLEDLNVDINIRDNNGVTALNFACSRGHPALARYLVNSGADVNTRTDIGASPILDASFSDNTELMQFLVDHGADLRDTNNWGVGTLHYSAGYASKETVAWLLDQGLNPRAETNAGETALVWAVIRGNYDTAELLRDKGLDINYVNTEGQTILHRTRNMTVETLDYLLTNGATVDIADTSGITPLHMASMAGRTEIVEKLLDHGADIQRYDQAGRTPLLSAVHSDSLDAVSLLLDRGALVNPDQLSALKICQIEARTPIHEAVGSGDLEMVKLLLERGADVNIRAKESGQTPLHTAIIKGLGDITQALLNHNADPNLPDSDDHQPLYYAHRYGHTTLADLLKSVGAKSRRVEKPYRKNYLEKELQQDSAALWYLGHSGYGIRTKNHFLIFDYWEMDRPPDNPHLNNGWIAPDELADENVIVFVSHSHGDHYDPVIWEWHDAIPDIRYVFGFEPREDAEYHVMTGRDHYEIDGVRISSIDSNDSGVGFLVEADGLVIYHSGDHANRERDFSGNYLAEIEYLHAMEKPIDLAFMPISGCGFGDLVSVKLGIYRTLEMLNPAVFIPVHAINAEYRYDDFIDEYKKAGYHLQTAAPDHRGDRILYSRKKGRSRLTS